MVDFTFAIIIVFNVPPLYRHERKKALLMDLGFMSCWATALAMAITFVLFFQEQNKMSWLLFIMVVTALSTRLFEEIKRAWLSELIFC